MNESETRTVSEILHRLQAKGFARMVGISWIHNKQQNTLSNQNITIYGKLWKRIENGSRHQKKGKDGESNRVCREDEKGTRESKSNIEESIGRNKATSR